MLRQCPVLHIGVSIPQKYKKLLTEVAIDNDVHSQNQTNHTIELIVAINVQSSCQISIYASRICGKGAVPTAYEALRHVVGQRVLDV